MKVYADIIFIINFLMDFFIFWAAGKFIKKNISIKRMLIGAFFSATMYCIIVFIKALNFLYNPLCILIIMIFSVFITFGAESLKELLKNTVYFIIISFTLGGLTEGLFYFFNVTGFISDFIDVYIHNFSIKFLALSVSLFYVLLKFIIIQYKKITIKKQVFCDTEIYLKDRKDVLRALVDTGNSLYEPISGKPVIIAELSALEETIPKEMKNFFMKNGNSVSEKLYDYIKFENSGVELRIIPFSSVGKKKGAIMGFFADKAIIHSEKDFCCEKAVIGICNFKLSKEGNFNALLNPEMLKEVQ